MAKPVEFDEEKHLGNTHGHVSDDDVREKLIEELGIDDEEEIEED